MKNIKGTKTEINLLKAFTGESQDMNRYTYFASQAKKEGYIQIEKIFLETAENERSHAKQFFKFLEGGTLEITALYSSDAIGTTLENLNIAASGEHEEYSNLYPLFAEEAEEEGFNKISAVFKIISKIEYAHEIRFKKLIKNIFEEKVFSKEDIVNWKCIKCGHIHRGKNAPAMCPGCMHPKDYFEIENNNY